MKNDFRTEYKVAELLGAVRSHFEVKEKVSDVVFVCKYK